MQIIKVDQRSEEWFDLRAKKMTASHAQAISANGKGLQTYIREMMAEFYSSEEPKRFSNSYTDWGTEQEPIARMIYEFETGRKVEEIGFVIHNDYVGCSPDGFVDEDGMIEIKCLSDKVYLNLLLDEKIESKYLWQMQMQMLVSERNWNDFFVYNPHFKQSYFLRRVEKDQAMFDKLNKGFESGEAMIKEIMEKMK